MNMLIKNISLSAPVVTDERTALSHTFNILKWVLALMVVADHFLRSYSVTAGDEIYVLTDNLNVGRLARWVESFLKNYAVPVFFIMSAYLFQGAAQQSWQTWRDKLRRRMRTLVWPYFVWNTVGLFAGFFIALFFVALGLNSEALSQFDISSWQWSGVIGGYFYPDWYYYPHNTPLWYVRDLLILFLLTPLLTRVVSRFGLPLIITLIAVCTFCFDGFNHRYWVSLSYYCIGLYLAVNRIDFSGIRMKWLLLAAAFYLVNGYLHFTCRYDFSATLKLVMKNLNILVGAYVALGGVYVLVKYFGWRGTEFLAGASFFIYVIHHPFKEAFKSVVFFFVHPQGETTVFFTLILAYVLYVGVLLGMYLALTKVSGLSKFLLGRGN